jgi:hypothetical protein
MSRARTLLLLFALTGLNSGCVLGSEQAPGCRLEHPGDCPSGWSCRSGVCLRPTTSLSPSAAEAGDAPGVAEGGPKDAQPSEN